MGTALPSMPLADMCSRQPWGSAACCWQLPPQGFREEICGRRRAFDARLRRVHRRQAALLQGLREEICGRRRAFYARLRRAHRRCRRRHQRRREAQERAEKIAYLLAALAAQVWGDGIQEIVIITGRSKGQRRTRGLNRRRAQNARTRHVRYRERVAAFALHRQMVLQHQMESEAAAAQQRSAASQLLLAAVDV